ncbi:MAG: transposase, partial [Desulfobacterales bacterium]|nr:transposase [Desulfobacterales bacterium]
MDSIMRFFAVECSRQIVAISNSRMINVEDRQVTFRYKKGKSARWRNMTLDVMEFIRRFLQHVLPTGFMKIRYFGFLHPGSSFSL